MLRDAQKNNLKCTLEDCRSVLYTERHPFVPLHSQVSSKSRLVFFLFGHQYQPVAIITFQDRKNGSVAQAVYAVVKSGKKIRV